MRINNQLIPVNHYGMYNAAAIYDALDSPQLPPDKYIKEIIDQNVSAYDSESLYEIKYGSRQTVFLCDFLAYNYLLINKYEHLLKIKNEMEADSRDYFLIRFKNSSVFQDERDTIYNKGYRHGACDTQNKLPGKTTDQAMEINLEQFWQDCVSVDTNHQYEEFLKHVQIASFLFLDTGQGEVLSRYDWEANTYWITPEFGFYLLAYFPAVSSEMRNGLRSLIRYKKGNISQSDAL